MRPPNDTSALVNAVDMNEEVAQYIGANGVVCVISMLEERPIVIAESTRADRPGR